MKHGGESERELAFPGPGSEVKPKAERRPGGSCNGCCGHTGYLLGHDPNVFSSLSFSAQCHGKVP